MTRIMLEAIASGAVRTTADIDRFVRCTLLERTAPDHGIVRQATLDALKYLAQNDFITWNKTAREYGATKLGQATFSAALGPDEALAAHADLSEAQRGIVLEGDLHVVYLATPVCHDIAPQWRSYGTIVDRLSAFAKEAARRIGINEGFLNVAAFNDSDVGNLQKTDPKVSASDDRPKRILRID